LEHSSGDPNAGGVSAYSFLLKQPLYCRCYFVPNSHWSQRPLRSCFRPAAGSNPSIHWRDCYVRRRGHLYK